MLRIISTRTFLPSSRISSPSSLQPSLAGSSLVSFFATCPFLHVSNLLTNRSCLLLRRSPCFCIYPSVMYIYVGVSNHNGSSSALQVSLLHSFSRGELGCHAVLAPSSGRLPIKFARRIDGELTRRGDKKLAKVVTSSRSNRSMNNETNIELNTDTAQAMKGAADSRQKRRNTSSTGYKGIDK